MPNKTKHKDLTNGSIGHHLITLTLPTIGGMLAIIVFNVTDTFFVSKLGTDALAAMGFTFPVVMFIGTLGMGISSGTTSVVSRALGGKDHHFVRRVATDGLLLVLLLMLCLGGIGLLTVDSLFSALGATAETLPFVKDYMMIWYLGVFASPGVTDGILRAAGDMKRPVIVMIVCAVINFILDYLLIFGKFGFPEMGIKGAALATVIARIIAVLCSLYFIHVNTKMLDYSIPKIKEVLNSWKKILHVGAPAAASHLLPVLLRGLMTTMAAGLGGAVTVAAIAAGSRIEGLGMIISMAYGTALMPLVGQNWGAGNFHQVNKVRKISNRFSIVYGIIVILVALPLAPVLAGLFTEKAEVLKLTILYIRIMAFSFLFCNILPWTSLKLNAVGKPFPAMLLNVLGIACIVIPCVILGAWLYDFCGMLVGLIIGQLILALIAIFWGRYLLCPERAEKELRI
jgi:MATE family, multidrug efflux pump